MTTQNIKIKKSVIRSACIIIRNTLDDDSVHSISEVVQALANGSIGFTVDNSNDIVQLLQCHYSVKTIRRLLRHLKEGVVWDTSICNLPEEELQALFLKEDYDNIIPSPMFDELLSLSKSARPNSRKASFLLNCILNDTGSKHSNAIVMQKSEVYVDTQLLTLCQRCHYALYTYDIGLALRARSRGIKTYYLNPSSSSPYTYTPSLNGKNVFLDVSVLNRPLISVISLAQDLGCNKFVLSTDFVEQLELKKDSEHVRKYMQFFISDTDGQYTSYCKNCISSVENEYNTILFTADPRSAFTLKHNCVPFAYIADCTRSSIAYTPSKSKLTATSNATLNKLNRFVSVIDVAPDQSVFCKLPCYSPEKMCLVNTSLHSDYTSKIWLLDQDGNELSLGSKILPKHKVVHYVASSDGQYYLNVYYVVRRQQNFCGRLVFTKTFSSETVSSVPKAYQVFVR